VSAYSREPSGENQTRLTGPVAGDASARSMLELPTRRQFGRTGFAGVCADAGSAASKSIPATQAFAKAVVAL
jgi:hypothetical protein